MICVLSRNVWMLYVRTRPCGSSELDRDTNHTRYNVYVVRHLPIYIYRTANEFISSNDNKRYNATMI